MKIERAAVRRIKPHAAHLAHEIGRQIAILRRFLDEDARGSNACAWLRLFVKNGDFLLVGFYANPVLDGFPDTSTGEWRGNPWHPDLASKDPKRLAYLRALKAMGEKYFEQLRTVLR